MLVDRRVVLVDRRITFIGTRITFTDMPITFTGKRIAFTVTIPFALSTLHITTLRVAEVGNLAVRRVLVKVQRVRVVQIARVVQLLLDAAVQQRQLLVEQVELEGRERRPRLADVPVVVDHAAHVRKQRQRLVVRLHHRHEQVPEQRKRLQRP